MLKEKYHFPPHSSKPPCWTKYRVNEARLQFTSPFLSGLRMLYEERTDVSLDSPTVLLPERRSGPPPLASTLSCGKALLKGNAEGSC